MPNIVLSVLGHLATYCSLLGLYLTILPLGTPRPEWHWLLIILGSISMLWTMTADAWRQYLSLPTICNSTDAIRAYMNNWIRSGGRVLSLSRDLSWVDKDNERLLIEKSKRNELILLVEKDTALTRRLKGAGAEIHYYGPLNHTPRSRFTIVDFERDGARVAVGASNGDEHVIQEFRNGHHPLFAIAEDLANIIIRYNKAIT